MTWPRLRVPVLMMAGEEDPITPIPLSEMTAQCIPPHLVRFERLDNCGHNVAVDNPDVLLAQFESSFLLNDRRR